MATLPPENSRPPLEADETGVFIILIHQFGLLNRELRATIVAIQFEVGTREIDPFFS